MPIHGCKSGTAERGERTTLTATAFQHPQCQLGVPVLCGVAQRHGTRPGRVGGLVEASRHRPLGWVREGVWLLLGSLHCSRQRRPERPAPSHGPAPTLPPRPSPWPWSPTRAPRLPSAYAAPSPVPATSCAEYQRAHGRQPDQQQKGAARGPPCMAPCALSALRLHRPALQRPLTLSMLRLSCSAKFLVFHGRLHAVVRLPLPHQVRMRASRPHHLLQPTI
mmetsp:Transcript_2660/g.6659  ORF Transcript_2660/g.6659 Transcript_2660/m.6659 type:complete len:221 (+) Transcript_2660:1091-1753(+)